MKYLWYGWLDTMAQSDFEWLSRMRSDVLLTFEYAYITCVDSCRNVNELLAFLAKLDARGYSPEVTANGLKLRTKDLVDAARLEARILNGFDEVWFYESEPTLDYPDWLQITSEAPITSRSPLLVEQIGAWMANAGCFLGLGDGCGLNYITRSNGAVETLEDLNSQCRQGIVL